MAASKVQANAATTITSSGSPEITTSLTGVAAGSVMLLIAVSGSGGFATLPSGYTQDYIFEGGPSAGDQCAVVMHKTSPSSTESPVVVFDHHEEHAIYLVEAAGLDTTSPFDVGSAIHNYVGGGATTVQPGSTGTLENADSIVVSSCWLWTTDKTGSVDSGFTKDFDLHNASSMNWYTGFKVTTVDTALNPTWSWDGVSTPVGAIIGAFKGAAAAGGLPPRRQIPGVYHQPRREGQVFG